MDLFINEEYDDEPKEVVTMSTLNNEPKIEIRSSFLRGSNVHTKKLSGMEERKKAFTDIFSKSVFVISKAEYDVIYQSLQDKGDLIKNKRLNIIMNIYFIYVCYMKYEIMFSYAISNIFNEEINFKRSSDDIREHYMNSIMDVMEVKDIRYKSCPIKYYVRGLVTILRKRAEKYGFEVTEEDNMFLSSKTSQLYRIQENLYDIFLSVFLIGIKHNGFAFNVTEVLFDVCLYNVMMLVKARGEDVMPYQYQEDLISMIDTSKGFNRMLNLTKLIKVEREVFESLPPVVVSSIEEEQITKSESDDECDIIWYSDDE